jgi:serine/threonine protein kinase
VTPERWQQVEPVLAAALERRPEERSSFLKEACAGDDSLLREVESILAADASANGEFEEIAAGLAAEWAACDQREDLIGQTIGRYQILAPLASGGMGEVFLAQDTVLDRKVALKLLPREFTRDPERLRRFEQEARAASALNHPNIITIYEIGESDGTRFIANEYVEGKTLREVIGGSRRDISKIVEIGCQAASALAAAHGAGIVHRDIKPANIMLRQDGYVKVVDFGLAKLSTVAPQQLDVTEPGRVMGTVNYMSPEQALGKPLDHRTDIFSLGVVLYELATGRRLFAGQSEAATYNCILNQEATPLREIDPALPEELDLVVRRALEKDPERRYQSAADLRDDLRRLASGTEQTEAARVALARERARRRSRNLRVAAVAALILTLAAGVFFVGQQIGGKRSAVQPNEISRKSIAVLPFADLNHDPDSASFTEGVQDQILTDLTKVADLKVIGRTSVRNFHAGAARDRRAIGQQLRVAYLLEGNVQRAGETVRVEARLFDAKRDAQVWSETYELEVANVFAIRSEIAKKIAVQLRAKLSPAETAEIERRPTADLTAFNLYTRGKTLIELARSDENPEENSRAGIDLLTQAVERDPTFFVAWCRLADAHATMKLWGLDNTPERRALGEAAVEAARRLAPDAGETHLAAARLHYSILDYGSAREELERARRTLPNDPRTLELSAYINRRQSRWEEATRDFERLMEIDPLNTDVLLQVAGTYEALHRYDEEAAILDGVIALRPERVGTRFYRALVDVFARADTRRYRAELEAALKQDPAAAKSLVRERITLAFWERDYVGLANALATLGEGRYGNDWAQFSRAFGEGMLARMTGDEAAARAAFAADRVAQERIVAAQPDYAPAISMLGLIDAGLGRKEDALREGRRAVELLPVAKDSIRGTFMHAHLAIIAGWLGDKDLAIEQLLLHHHSVPAGAQHYGRLMLDPMWDALRGDPRFEAIVASLAPK